MERALQSVLKRDDDAELTVVIDDKDNVSGFYLETNEGALIAPQVPWLVQLEQRSQTCCLSLLDADLLYNETRRPLPDVHTRVVRYVHLRLPGHFRCDGLFLHTVQRAPNL